MSFDHMGSGHRAIDSALLVCEDCHRAIWHDEHELQFGSVDDVIGAAIRAGWMVTGVGPAGARWHCPACAHASSASRRRAHDDEETHRGALR